MKCAVIGVAEDPPGCGRRVLLAVLRWRDVCIKNKGGMWQLLHRDCPLGYGKGFEHVSRSQLTWFGALIKLRESRIKPACYPLNI